MKLIRQLYGIFLKELALQSRSRLNILNRLLIGPVISSLTVGMLYAGFFRYNHSAQLGPLSATNFIPSLALGFLAHTYMNAGYYFLSNKILSEWIGRTLPLIWLAPCGRSVLFLGMIIVEALRCSLITFFVFLFLAQSTTLSLPLLFSPFLFLPGFLLLGAALGLLRSYVFLLNEGRAELMDHCYLGMIFLGCFYIPQPLLPSFLQPFCFLNPAFHGMTAWQSLETGTLAWSSVGGLFAGLIVLFLLSQILWVARKSQILERSYG